MLKFYFRQLFSLNSKGNQAVHQSSLHSVMYNWYNFENVLMCLINCATIDIFCHASAHPLAISNFTFSSLFLPSPRPSSTIDFSLCHHSISFLQVKPSWMGEYALRWLKSSALWREGACSSVRSAPSAFVSLITSSDFVCVIASSDEKRETGRYPHDALSTAAQLPMTQPFPPIKPSRSLIKGSCIRP